MPSVDFDQLFKQFSQIKTGVVGDVMLDTYWWGKVERISPEAPVPIVAVREKEERIGGAGNVALNLVALDANVSVITLVGDDAAGNQLINLMNEKNINTKYILKSKHRITTNKTRIISQNQQMMRLDEELVSDLQKEEEEKLLFAFEAYLAAESPQIVVFEDYNKGVLTEQVIARMMALCTQQHILTAVDPKRKNFFSFKGATIFKPNLKEVKEALNILSEKIDAAALKDIHLLLQANLEHDISLITLSEKGIFFQQKNKSEIVPTHVRSIADVSGAGDTVIAVAALVYAATKEVKLMAEMANIAGGLVCEEVGTAAINKSRLLNECRQLL